MATISITSLGLGNADLTAIGKLSETGLSQIEVADAVVEGDKLKKGNIPAGQVGAYTKAEVDALITGGTDLSDYYNKTEVDNIIANIPETDLSNYYNKTEVYNKLESYSKAEVDALITGGGADLSDYYTKAQVDSLIDAIPETDLSDYYNKTEVDSLIPDISTKQDILVSATNIKTINGESILGSGDLVISGGGTVDLSEYYKKTETYSKVEVDTKIADIPPTDLSGYYDKTETYNKVEVENLIDTIPEVDLSGYYDKAETETLLSNKVDKGVGVVGATKTKITYNNDGIITGGADLEEADLPDISQSKITNLVSDLSNKQDKLLSGTNIKTINGESILGSGDIVITGGGSGEEVDLTNYYTKSETYSKDETDLLVDTKQDVLVSGTSIKTINGQSVLGNGNIFITAEADLSNYYTKYQVNEFINEINAEIGLAVILDEYGVSWNQETDVYAKLGSSDRVQIQKSMKRCVLNDDGTVNYYLDPFNSTLKADGTPADLTGADGNVMVQVPKFWYKHTLVGDTHEWWVSNTPLEGYSVHPWFLEGGVEHDYRYYRAYTCINQGGVLRSVSGVRPTGSQNIAKFRTQARANGIGWGLCSWNAVNAIQLLFLTEYCTLNSQNVLGRGNDDGGDFGITTGQSNVIGNASSGASNNNMWMSYRGIENFYADAWEFIDGMNVQNYKVYLNQNPATFADDVFTGDYVDSGITLPVASSSYVKKISGNFLPTAIGGSSSTYVTDACWATTGNRIAFFGGAANHGVRSGAFCLYASMAASYNDTNVGAGLSR